MAWTMQHICEASHIILLHKVGFLITQMKMKQSKEDLRNECHL
jgi:hypothetical protein